MTGFRCGRCWAGATSERPGVRHDRGEVGSFWLPPQLALRSIAGGDEHRRVARSPRRRLRRDGVPGDLPAGVEHLPYREACHRRRSHC
jgi:hypothetical protein